ncbi:MAG TPA: hypothetical protein VKV32_06370 [Stellaceae bacterium]|nr:hypothetical protein [Stellaceae bacterium]
MHKLVLLGMALGVVLGVGARTGPAAAHGFAGQRFFPATIQTDDPFTADEMSLPTLTLNPRAADGSRESDVGFDLSKRITRNTDFTIGDQWKYFHVPGAPGRYGWDALTTGQQYQLFINPDHEAMALAGLGETWAHTGRVNGAGAADFTTLSPTLDFGKGFGDLPDWLTYARPLALTSNLSVDFPTKTESAGTSNPDNFNAGVALEYSLEYLEHHVKDVGLGAPFDRMIPLVEWTSTTNLNRMPNGSVTTGLIAPGLIWAGQYYQLGGELLLPYGNSAQGHGIGGVLQFHLYLDDIFPNTIGRPIFGD